jgi:lipopolysaccharide transport system permease protein
MSESLKIMNTEEVQTNPLHNEHWDMVLSPKTGLFDINIKEIWHYRDLLVLFVKRDFIAQFKQTILGPVWHFIQPIFTTIIFLMVFGKIANIPTDGIEPKFLFYMSGITIWNYFASCLNATSNTFVANAGIFGKVYFPRLVLPLSVVISNIVKFGIQFLLLTAMILFCFFFKGTPLYFSITWFIIPLLVLMMAAFGLGLGIIISSLTTKYRDFNILIGFAVQLLMYATPVAYPVSFLKGKSYASWVQWNPLSPIVEAFRYAVFGHGSFTFSSLGYSAVIILVTLLTGLLLFNKVEKSFMDTV